MLGEPSSFLDEMNWAQKNAKAVSDDSVSPLYHKWLKRGRARSYDFQPCGHPLTAVIMMRIRRQPTTGIKNHNTVVQDIYICIYIRMKAVNEE